MNREDDQPTPAWQTLSRALGVRGLDVCHPFSLARVNAAISPFALPSFGERGLGLLVGNTRALWPLVRAVVLRGATPAPLDDFVEAAVTAALKELPVQAWVGWAHRLTAPVIPIQRIALAAGFADLSPTHLSVHPEFGPWFALRAVVVLDVAVQGEDPDPVSLCAACTKPCVAALDAALGEEAPTKESVRRRAAAWVRVRDACPVGRAARYADEEIAYYYAGVTPCVPGEPTERSGEHGRG